MTRLKPKSVDFAAFAALDVELDVDDAVSAIVLGFARQGLDGRLSVGFGARTAGGPPGSLRSNSSDRNCTPAVIGGGRKTHSHEVSVHMLKR